MHAKENVDEIGARLQMGMSASSAQNLMQMLHGHPYKRTVHKFYDRL
jgi:hypothetical protein